MNKNLFTLFVLFFLLKFSEAQITNADFETWALSGGYLNPVGWTTSNGMSTTANVVQGAPYSGTYSMHLLTDAVAGGGYANSIYYGSVRPDVLSGWWKGTIAGAGDVMTVTIQVLDASFNEIGWGDAEFGATQSSWTQFSAPVTYEAPGVAASFIIDFQLFAQSTASEAFVDHLSLTTTTGIEEIEGTKQSIYPNPTHNTFTISFSGQLTVDNGQLKIYDMTGREVYRDEIVHRTSYIVNQNLSPGIYFVRVEAGKKVYQQKLVVE
jgi:hypothetical protein